MKNSKVVDKLNLLDLFIILIVTFSCIAVCIVIARGLDPSIDLTIWDFVTIFLSTGVLAFLSIKGIAKKSFDKFEKVLDPDNVL